MVAYIILQLNILFLLLLRKLTKIKGIVYIIVFFLVLFSGLRYGVGVDYFSYYEHFQKIYNNSEIQIEPGIILVVKIAKTLNLNIQAVFLISALITIIFFMKYIENFTKNYFISWIIFISYGTFFLGSLNLVKQYIAISIFAYSLQFVYKRQPIKYILSILLATLFHYSAIILITLYFLHVKFKFIHFVIISILFYLFVQYGIDHLIMMTKYSIYLDSRWAHTMNNNRNLIMVYAFILLNILIILFSNRIKKIKGSYIFINMSFLSLLLMLAALLVDYLPNMFFFRINNYLMVSYIILPTFFLYRMNKTIRVIVSISIIFLMYLYFFITLYFKGDDYSLVPYLLNYKIF